MKVDYVMTECFATPDRGFEYKVVVVVDGGADTFADTFKESNGFHVNDMVEKMLNDLGVGHLSAEVTATSGPYQVYRVTK